jgi:hypothetical protein
MVNCLSLIKVGVVKLMKEIKVPDTAILRQEMRDPTNDVHREEMPGMMMMMMMMMMITLKRINDTVFI